MRITRSSPSKYMIKMEMIPFVSGFCRSGHLRCSRYHLSFTRSLLRDTSKHERASWQVLSILLFTCTIILPRVERVRVDSFYNVGCRMSLGQPLKPMGDVLVPWHVLGSTKTGVMLRQSPAPRLSLLWNRQTRKRDRSIDGKSRSATGLSIEFGHLGIKSTRPRKGWVEAVNLKLF
ncbi:hypothetical protein B0H66DRAFT_337382 [Apodospora peruviana]|uniref:Uncharacterized protein n=1 Tax=Apodospora peruviana TaxID=516989 RepID=A0AAE0M173_9PEZI|nr:hypothetical protein B0H66DRAFT_337382 [Apodospora peruviana]